MHMVAYSLCKIPKTLISMALSQDTNELSKTTRNQEYKVTLPEDFKNMGITRTSQENLEAMDLHPMQIKQK